MKKMPLMHNKWKDELGWKFLSSGRFINNTTYALVCRRNLNAAHWGSELHLEVKNHPESLNVSVALLSWRPNDRLVTP